MSSSSVGSRRIAVGCIRVTDQDRRGAPAAIIQAADPGIGGGILVHLEVGERDPAAVEESAGPGGVIAGVTSEHDDGGRWVCGHRGSIAPDAGPGRLAGCGADQFVVEPHRMHEVHRFAPAFGEQRAGLGELVYGHLEGSPLNRVRALMLRERLDPVGDEASANRRGLLRQYERDGMRIRVVREPARGQRIHQPRRRRGADLPLGPGPATHEQGRAHLGQHLIEVGERLSARRGVSSGHDHAVPARILRLVEGCVRAREQRLRGVDLVAILRGADAQRCPIRWSPSGTVVSPTARRRRSPISATSSAPAPGRMTRNSSPP